VDGADWLEVTYRLPAGLAHLEITNRLSKSSTWDKESAFFAFPFAVDQPTVLEESAGGLTGPGLDQVPGGAEYMRAIRHFVALQDGDAAIGWATAEAPLIQVGNLALPYVPFPATLPRTEPGTVFSWVHNNIWDTNFPASRGGEIEFHYAISTADPNDGTGPARRLAESLTAPLLCLVAGATRPEVAPAGSFCEFAGDDVELVAVRRPRFGHDLAVLVQSGAGDADVTLRLPSLAVRRTWIGDHLERELVECVVADGVVRARLHRGRLSTVLLDLGDSGY
jgi:hypothetical protein